MSSQIVEDNTLFSVSSDSAILKYNGQMNSRLLFQIPNFINTTADIKATFFSINTAVIPASFYNVSTFNNAIYINNQKYLFNTGNYNITQLLTMMNTRLPTGYYFEYDQITNRLQLFSPVLSWSIQPTQSTCYRLIGWNNTEDFVFTARDQYASPNVVNLLTTPRIFVRSSTIDCRNYSDESESSDILGVIPNTACLNGVIHFVNYNGVNHLVSKDVINFDLQLTDDEKNLIDFQGCPIYITFNIKTIREVIKPPTFQDMFKQANTDLEIYNAEKAIQPQKIYLASEIKNPN
jgi:hypothetical protein